MADRTIATTTGDAPERPVLDIVEAVGQNIKRVRTARGLSQAALARRSGIAKATLSQLEVARGNPTIETLFALAKELGVPLGVLLHDVPVDPVRVSRAEGRPVIAGTAVDMSLVDSFTSETVLHEIYLIHVRKGRQEAAPHAPGVQERLLVTAGTLRTGPTSDPIEVGPGDHVCFPADRPHFYEAVRGPVTTSLLITYPLAAQPHAATRSAA